MKSHTVSHFLFSTIHIFNFRMFLHLAIEFSLWGISSCCLFSSHLPWWEWTVTFQSLWTGKGGSNGRVGVKMAHSTCVCACVSGCWQYVPCWDCTLQQPLNIQLPSISPSVIITDHQTHWLTQQLSRLYRCMYECVCVWICLFEVFFKLLPEQCECLHLRVEWRKWVFRWFSCCGVCVFAPFEENIMWR